MIDNIESKIENLRLQQCSLNSRSFWKLVISPETETVTSGLCHIEDLIFLENDIVWFWKCVHTSYKIPWESSWLSLLLAKVWLKLIHHKRFLCDLVNLRTCGESTLATLLLIEDSTKNFFREFYTISFRRVILATPAILLTVSCFGKSSIVFKRSLVEYFPEAAIHLVVF